jgi:glutamate dehydrogenase/leucine dehydrogenase
MGTTQADMDVIFAETSNVTGISPAHGGSGDPSAATAYGLLWAMKAVRTVVDDTADLAGSRIVVSGVGKVGSALVRHLVGEGATVTVADVSPAAVDRLVAELGVAAVPVGEAHRVECDIFSPCALGGVLDETSIAGLRSRAVVGSANNQLATPEDGRRLAERGIVYAPDFVVNSGGVINIADELAGYEPPRAAARVRGIYDTVRTVLAASRDEGTTPNEVAEAMAERRLADAASASAGVRRFEGTAGRRL